ncbi:MAG TPA: hypothetical protein ENG06_06160 [Thermoplasmatales archaeon]|nr:hypothetical protein [Thermoplasmatales archaeon]
MKGKAATFSLHLLMKVKATIAPFILLMKGKAATSTLSLSCEGGISSNTRLSFFNSRERNRHMDS